MKSLDQQVRDRLWGSLSPGTAAIAGLRLEQLQQVLLGYQPLTEEQVKALARHFNIREPVRT